MTRRGKDVYSFSYNCLRAMRATPTETHLLNAFPAASFAGPSCSAVHVDSQRTMLQILRFKWMQPALVHSAPGIKFGAQHRCYTVYERPRRTVYLSYSSYRTISTHVEKVDSEVVAAKLDRREEIRLAMLDYLKQTLKIESNLATKISQNCPVFLDGLVETLKVVQKDNISDPEKSVNNLVLDFLAESKFSGVEPLMESVGFSPQEISRASEYARSGIKGVLIKLDLLKSMGVMPEHIPRVIYRNPRLLSSALGSHQVKVRYLSTMGMSPEEICKMIISYPKSLSFVLKDGCLPLVDFLKTAGVKDEEMGKVFGRCPQLLTLSVERKLKPALQMLESVGITGSSLRRVLVVQPSLLRRKLDRNIAFCREYGLDEKPGVIARLLLTCPNLSVEGWNARVSYLESIGLTKNQIIAMVNKNPAFMSLNVQTALAPKVDYLLNVMGRPIEDVVTAATFLTLSLEHRIKPRYSVLAALQEAGLPIRSYSLSTLGGWSDEYFYKKFVEKSPKKVQELWLNHSSRSPTMIIPAAI